MYYPLSQITTNLTSTSGEFTLASNGKDYIGSYFSTSDGNYYTGKTPQDSPNNKLIKTPNPPPPSSFETRVGSKIFSEQRNITSTTLPSGYANSLTFPISIATSPTSTIPLPTDQDYETGEFVRYFLKKTNSFLYMEVSKVTYTNYVDENPITQYQLYTPIKINWDLIGNPLNTYQVNSNIVMLAEKQYNILGFELFFKGKFVKYYKPISQNFFNTKGGELKIESNNENYAGFYHVNPNLGKIMEGKFHKPTFHNTLLPFKGDEIKGNVKVKVDNEVGTSKRTNYQRNSGY